MLSGTSKISFQDRCRIFQAIHFFLSLSFADAIEDHETKIRAALPPKVSTIAFYSLTPPLKSSVTRI